MNVSGRQKQGSVMITAGSLEQRGITRHLGHAGSRGQGSRRVWEEGGVPHWPVGPSEEWLPASAEVSETVWLPKCKSDQLLLPHYWYLPPEDPRSSQPSSSSPLGNF